MFNIFRDYKKKFNRRYLLYNFSQKYLHGEKISYIDHSLSAKKGELFVKKYSECRDIDVILVLDISLSQIPGSSATKLSKMQDFATRICEIANEADDRVGVITFSSEVETYIPASSRVRHINVENFLKEGLNKSDPRKMLLCLQKILKKSTVIFWISDFLYSDKVRNFMLDGLRLLMKKHDLVCVQIVDSVDEKLPKVGKIRVQDAESNKIVFCDTSNKNFIKYLTEASNKWYNKFKKDMNKGGIKLVQLRTDSNLSDILLQCFNKHLA